MFKYIFYSIPRLYLYVALSLVCVLLLAGVARFLLQDFLAEPITESPEESSPYVVTYELPDGREETITYEHTPEAVVKNAEGVSTEVVPEIPLETYGEVFKATLNVQIAGIDELSTMLQRDLPLMMLELQQLGLSGDFEAAIAGVPEVQAAVEQTRVINREVYDNTILLMIEVDQLSADIPTEELTVAGTYGEKTVLLTDEIDKLLNLYDTVYADERLDPIQLPSQEEVRRSEELARSVSEAFAGYGSALEAFLGYIY